MGRKIVILNGSPRKNGNTSGLIEAFIEGTERAGNTVTCFNLQQMEIHPCMGCFRGGETPESPCVQKDGMEQIYPAYREADVVVLAGGAMDIGDIVGRTVLERARKLGEAI